jgi:hypothetical protein
MTFLSSRILCSCALRIFVLLCILFDCGAPSRIFTYLLATCVRVLSYSSRIFMYLGGAASLLEALHLFSYFLASCILVLISYFLYLVYLWRSFSSRNFSGLETLPLPLYRFFRVFRSSCIELNAIANRFRCSDYKQLRSDCAATTARRTRGDCVRIALRLCCDCPAILQQFCWIAKLRFRN